MTFGLIAAIYAAYLTLVLGEMLSEYLVDANPTAAPVWQFFYYFTEQSNILVWAWLIVFAVANLGQGGLAAKASRLVNSGIALGLTLYMLVVFIVVSCILNPFYSGQFEPVPTGGGLYVHVLSPIIMFAFYMLYPWRGRASWRTVLAWMSYLIVYVVLANVVGAVAHWYNSDGVWVQAYPYNFLNPHKYASVALYGVTIAGLALAVFLLGVALLRLKQRFDAGYRPAIAAAQAPARRSPATARPTIG